MESLVGGSAGGDGDGGGGCVRRNRCVRVKAAFTRSEKSRRTTPPGNAPTP